MRNLLNIMKMPFFFWITYLKNPTGYLKINQMTYLEE